MIPELGYISPALAPEEPGSSCVVDIMPGATDDGACTREFEWNRYFTFASPQMVACVMAY
jgi:hypothetical protein